jgi:XRE family transcriptional regulator, regulator of sulfur utilization
MLALMPARSQTRSKTPPAPKAALGVAIKKARLKKGMTQEQLAHEAGMSLSTLARIETGAHEARISTILLIAKALGVSAASLIDECEANLKKY